MKRISTWIAAAVAAGVLLAGATLRELPASPAGPDRGAVPTPTRTLFGAILYQSSDLALPSGIAVAGDRLIVSDDFADHGLRVLHRGNGAVERAIGRKGRGPREFESIFAIDVIDPGGEIMVHDPTLQRITRIDLEADFEDDEWAADRSVTLRADAMVLVAGWTGDGFVGLGSFTDGRLAHLSPDGQLVRMTGEPVATPSQVSRSAWTRAYQGRLKPDPGRTRWAVVSRFADRLEIYDAAGGLRAVADRPYGFGPADPTVDDPEAVRFGYIDVATTETRIYALFSGRTRAEGAANLGDRVHVFDWQGRLLDVWQLDQRVIAVAITPEADRLYGVRHDPVPAVVEFALE